MRLEPLCEMDFRYRREALYDDEPFKYVVPFGTQEAGLYGEGEATFSGRLSGHGRFLNHARRRSDGVNLPDVHGILRTDDGAFVLFTMQGRTPPSADGKRRVLGTVLFESDDARYAWLNTEWCVMEALLQSGGVTHTRIALCVPELD